MFSVHKISTITFSFLSLALAASATSAATQATTQGVIWGTVDSTPVFLNNIDTATGMDFFASVNNTLTESGYTFDFASSAGIDTGQLKVLNRASSDGSASGSATKGLGTGLPSTYARILEELLLVPQSNDPYTVTMTMAIHGNYQQDPTGTGWAGGELTLSVNGGQFEQELVTIVPSMSPFNHVLTSSLTLQGIQTVNVYSQLASDIVSISGPNAFTEFDFANTAQLALSVSQGVAVTSGSGVFLANAVPLPGALPLLGGGVLLLAMRRRRVGSENA